MALDIETHITLIKLAIAYTFIGAIIFTVIVTCLSLIGIVKFSKPDQQNKLFGVLIIEVVTIAIGVFSNLLLINPKVAQKAMAEEILKFNQSSPQIASVTQQTKHTENGIVIDQLISFSDPEGDAQSITWLILATNSTNKFNVISGSITTAGKAQINGATQLGQWKCGPETYWVEFVVLIADSAGNVSNPYKYTIHCAA